jgi:hypothetical protein
VQSIPVSIGFDSQSIEDVSNCVLFGCVCCVCVCVCGTGAVHPHGPEVSSSVAHRAIQRRKLTTSREDSQVTLPVTETGKEHGSATDDNKILCGKRDRRNPSECAAKDAGQTGSGSSPGLVDHVRDLEW